MKTNIVTTWINTKIRHEQSIQEVSHQIIESMPTSILYPSLTTGSAILGGIKSSQGIPLWASLPSRNKYLMALRILSGLTIGIVARAELPNVWSSFVKLSTSNNEGSRIQMNCLSPEDTVIALLRKQRTSFNNNCDSHRSWYSSSSVGWVHAFSSSDITSDTTKRSNVV